MKKKIISFILACTMVAGITACGGASTGTEAVDNDTAATQDNKTTGTNDNSELTSTYFESGEEGKVINIYCWNDEFRTRVEAVYDKVDHTSEDGTVTYNSTYCAQCALKARRQTTNP